MTPEHAPSSQPGGGGQGMSRLNPAAMPVADAARVLTRLGGKPVTEAMLRADIDAGAPANADGSVTATEATAKNTKRLLDASVDNGMRFA